MLGGISTVKKEKVNRVRGMGIPGNEKEGKLHY